MTLPFSAIYAGGDFRRLRRWAAPGRGALAGHPSGSGRVRERRGAGPERGRRERRKHRRHRREGPKEAPQQRKLQLEAVYGDVLGIWTWNVGGWKSWESVWRPEIYLHGSSNYAESLPFELLAGFIMV